MANIASHPCAIHQIETVIGARWIVPVELENVVLELPILAMDDVKSFSFVLLMQPGNGIRRGWRGYCPQHILSCGPVSRNVAGKEQVTYKCNSGRTEYDNID
jgi:hypothetical protein